MNRRLRYQVAVSLDGFIAGPDGNVDWIVPDASIDFAALFREFDTLVMGRKTWEAMAAHGGQEPTPGVETIVFSKTLAPSAGPGHRVTGDDPVETVRALKASAGRDLWLFGGGALFRTLLDAGLVDTVELAVMPVLLGEGVPLLPPGGRAALTLADTRVLPDSGIVILAYRVAGSTGAAPRIGFVTPKPGTPGQ